MFILALLVMIPQSAGMIHAEDEQAPEATAEAETEAPAETGETQEAAEDTAPLEETDSADPVTEESGEITAPEEPIEPEETGMPDAADEAEESTDETQGDPGVIVSFAYAFPVHTEIDEAESSLDHVSKLLPSEVTAVFDTGVQKEITLHWEGNEFTEHTYGTFVFTTDITEQYEVTCEEPYAEIRVTKDLSVYTARDKARHAGKGQKMLKKAPGSSVRDELLREYAETQELRKTDIHEADKTQKNRTGASDNTDDSYLYKSAEWTNIHDGEALIRLAAKGIPAVDNGAGHALFVFTDCPSHGWTFDLAVQKTEALLQNYDRVTLGMITGPYDKDILIEDVTDDPSREDYYVYKLAQMPWRGGDHYALNVYAALYKYFFGDFSSVQAIDQGNWPTAVYVQYDNLYEPCNYPAVAGMPAVTNVGVCDAYGMHYTDGANKGHRAVYDSNGQAYALGNAGRADSPLWDILKTYKNNGRYFSYALDGTTAQRGYFSRWENTSVINSSDIFRLNIFAGLAQPQLYDPASALSVPLLEDVYQRRNVVSDSASGWQHVYVLPQRYQPDYASVSEYGGQGIYPQNMILRDTVSDDYRIVRVDAGDEKAKVSIQGQQVTVIYPDYRAGQEVSAKIYVKADYTVKQKWEETNAGQAVSGTAVNGDEEIYTDHRTEPTVLTRTGYTLIINYLEKGTDKVLHERYVGVYQGGEAYDIASPEVQFYVLSDPAQKQVSGVMPNQDVEINVYYERDMTYAEPVKVVKKIIGNDSAEDVFRFIMEPETPGQPMPEKDTVTIKGAGEAEFGTIRFPLDGVYRYTIRELDDGEFGYETDDTVYTVTYTVEEGQVSRTITNEEIEPADETLTFAYTGNIQSFEAPADGYYHLEVWGGQGGNTSSSYLGGQGGYARGTVALNRGDVLYVAVGGAGQSIGRYGNAAGGWNGGGTSNGWKGTGGGTETLNWGAGGGGATSIQSELIADGQLSRYADHKNAVVIAAGGGGGAGQDMGRGQKEDNSRSASWRAPTGDGGGLEGDYGGYGAEDAHHPTGGTQTSGGHSRRLSSTPGCTMVNAGFGYGAYGSLNGGGGGGWYGGGAMGRDGFAAGGSGYIQSADTLQALSITPAVTLSDAETRTGGRTGNGEARITYKISNESGEAVFTNRYTVETEDQYAETEVRITKRILGEKVRPEDFTFRIEGVTEDAPMPETNETKVHCQETVTPVSFGRIVFTRPGEYTYRISEVKDRTVRQYTFGEDVQITYTVKKAEDGRSLNVTASATPEIVNIVHLYDLCLKKTGIGDSTEGIEFLFTRPADSEAQEKYVILSQQMPGEYTVSGYAEKEEEGTRMVLGEEKTLIIHGLEAGDWGLSETSVPEGYLEEENGSLITLKPQGIYDYALSEDSCLTDTDGERHRLRITGDTAYGEIVNTRDDSEIAKPRKSVYNSRNENISGKFVENGETLYYRIDVENTTKTVRTYTVRDPLPANCVFLEADHDGELKDGEVSWPSFKLNPEEKMTLGFQVRAEGDGIAIVNTAYAKITDTEYETNTVTNMTPADPVKAVKDLQGNDINGKNIRVAETYAYTVTVRNPGDAETRMIIRDPLPAEITFVSASDEGSVKDGVLVWHIVLPVHAEKTVSFRFQPKEEGVTIRNTAEVTMDEITRKTNTTENKTLLTPVKKVYRGDTEIDGEAVKAGEELRYEILVRKSSEDRTFVLRDTVPEETVFVKAEDGGSLEGNTVVWNVNAKAGETVKVHFTVRVKDSAAGKAIRNTAVLEAEGEKIPSNTTVNYVMEMPVKMVRNVVGASEVKETMDGGKRYVYTITVHNPKDTEQEVLITDELPKEVGYVSSDHDGKLKGHTVTWQISIPAKASETVRCVIVTPQFDTDISNMAVIRMDSLTVSTNTVTQHNRAPGVTVKSVRTGIDKPVLLIPCILILLGAVSIVLGSRRKP